MQLEIYVPYKSNLILMSDQKLTRLNILFMQ